MRVRKKCGNFVFAARTIIFAHAEESERGRFFIREQAAWAAFTLRYLFCNQAIYGKYCAVSRYMLECN